MRYRIALNSLRVLIVLLCSSMPALAAKKVALVIGNSEYEHASPLNNAVNDAQLISARLKELGFDVTLDTNTDFDRLTALLREFQSMMVDADVSLFYFAGHGIQFKEENFLLATDATIQDEHDVVTSGRRLNEILEAMQETSKLNLAFIDACRNNPFVDDLIRKDPSRSRSLGIARGLARSSNYANTLIAFATKPGDVALDGEGVNSPFAEAIATNIATPDLEVSTMLKRVTRDVLAATAGKQRPEVVASMDSEFYFLQRDYSGPKLSLDNDVAMEAAATSALKLAMAEDTDAAFEDIITRFPGTAASNIAENILRSRKPVVAPSAPAQDQAVMHKPPLADSTRLLLDRLSAAQSGSNAETAIASLAPSDLENQLGLVRDDYIKVQVALSMLGFDAGEADGAFGTKARAAVRSFQMANRIEATGYLDQKSLMGLVKVYEETPKTYEGLWTLEVHRFNPHPEDPAEINSRTFLSTATLRYRNGEFNLVDWKNFAGQSRNDDRNPFLNFRGKLSTARKVTLEFDADYLYGKRKIKRVSVSGSLPTYVAYGSILQFNGPRLERNAAKDEIWVRVELKRLK